MAGRSGRRGFDLRGKVVFFNCECSRIKQLLIAPLGRFKGNTCLSASLCLRFLTSYADVRDQTQTGTFPKDLELCEIGGRLFRVINECFMAHNSNHVTNELRIFFRHVFQWLQKSNLVLATGSGIGLAGLPHHLFYQEPMNFVLCHLFKDEFLDRKVLDIIASEDKKREMLIIILCHIWCRKTLPLWRQQILVKAALDANKPAKFIVLPELPSAVRERIDEYNKGVMQMCSSCAAEVVHDSADITGLPLTLDQPITTSNAREWNPVQPFVLLSRIGCPTASLSGSAVQFSTPQQLFETLGLEMTLESTAFPYVSVKEGLSGYIYGYYFHNDENFMRDYNGIKASAVYDAITNFTFYLSTLDTILQREMNRSENNRMPLQTTACTLVHEISSNMSKMFQTRRKYQK